MALAVTSLDMLVHIPHGSKWFATNVTFVVFLTMMNINVVFQFQQWTILFNSVIFGIFSQYSRIRSHFELYSLVLTRFSEKFLWSNFILIFWNGRRGCKGCHSYQKYLNSTFVVFWHFWEMFCHIVLLFNQQRKIVP